MGLNQIFYKIMKLSNTFYVIIKNHYNFGANFMIRREKYFINMFFKAIAQVKIWTEMTGRQNVFQKVICIVLAYRSSHPEVICKKDVPGNFTKFTGKNLCQSLF